MGGGGKMKINEFKNTLASVTPEVPEHFHSRVEMTLENIVSQEVQMKESTKQAIRTAGRFSRRTLVIALAIVLALGAIALAATQWHLFDTLSFMTGDDMPKNADSIMQGNLYQDTVNNVEITVQEAGYDGRTLLLRYSYRMLDVDTVYGITAAELYGDDLPEGMTPDTIVEGLKDNAEEALMAHNVGWWADAIWFNGEAMDMPDNSGGIIMGSTVPGEIIHTEYWRLDNEDVFLEGPVQISLPIGESQSPEYRHSIYDQETGKYRLPDKGVVTFTFDAKDISSLVRKVHPDKETKLPEVTAKVSEATFTPLMTYITLDLEVNPDALAAYIAENGEGYVDENGELLWAYGGMDVFSDYLMSLELVDGKGDVVFPGFYGQNGYGNDSAEYLYPYLETIPDELYLAPINDDGKGDLSQAVLVKGAD